MCPSFLPADGMSETLLQGFDHHCRYLNVCVAGRCALDGKESFDCHVLGISHV